ncbi:MAG TPA: di-heme oxidoredictase family protein [Blastocatellia bacterium]|nr:di-heme oxidoredictase family protein [Blastocatellia bacterium]
MKLLKLVVVMLFMVVALAFAVTLPNTATGSQAIQEALTHDMNVLTDDLFNGFGARGTPIDECVAEPVPNRSFEDNKFIFDELESPEDGLGPTYNAPGCGDCHQNNEVGGISQMRELRAGHLSGGVFVNPPGGSSLIQLRAIAANIQERLDNAPLENIRAFRTTLNTFGDGFVECIDSNTLVAIRNAQFDGFVGTFIQVPVVEAGNALRGARFGWKDQHASLVSFSGDAYLNEMGITNVFDGNGGLVENNSLGRSVAAFDEVADPEDDGDDVEAFANFMRATRAPGRGPITAAVTRGANLFVSIGCDICHTPSIVTAPPGTVINGGEFVVPAALGNKRIRPFSDFLLHDIGTGDGIVQNGGAGTRNMVRTPPLWGVRSRPELMHDGLSLTFNEAIQRHAGAGGTISRNLFNSLSAASRADVIEFLKSL